eukprot:TRINITY_DN1903_c0_g1_i5.p2 TRINITY_DN1903_c0_g1~~TRINITY_DN1903_c0_g1_i5.p2  ORF type:complete len:223 (-),score=31.03 TRINITY_DN1903_c0_g1_i5:517-1089(-)
MCIRDRVSTQSTWGTEKPSLKSSPDCITISHKILQTNFLKREYIIPHHHRSGLSAFAGSMAFLITDLAAYPIDTLKTRLQAPEMKLRNSQHNRGAAARGILPILVSSLPSSFVLFYIYDEAKGRLQNTSLHESFTHMGAASIARIPYNMLRIPAEVLKQQLQVGLDPTVGKNIKSIYKMQGPQGQNANGV